MGIWSNPVARLLPQRDWSELRRLAIAPNAPKNSASRMLAVMVRLLKRLRPQLVKVISYQDVEVHNGTIYRAAGWNAAEVIRGKSWTSPARKRPIEQVLANKVRWEKTVN